MNLRLFQETYKTEAQCLKYLEDIRWGKKAVCPHCQSTKTYKFSNGKLFKCGKCRKQFTAKVGTIFSDSKIPLPTWFLVIYLATSMKKGISSVQVAKYAGITQKSAWFMLSRIRHAFEQSGSSFMLEGEVEVDETYVGGDAKNRAYSKKSKEEMWAQKGVVFGMVERGGKAKIKHVKSSGARSLLPEINKGVKPQSVVYSDEWGSYKTLKHRGYIHGVINHREKYKDGFIHTNSVENFWSHLKRGIDGVYHQVSVKHLQKYCSEYEYRFNTRDLDDYARFEDWFKLISCRLTYRELIGG